MASKKLSEIPIITSIAAGDEIPFTSAPGGTPVSKNITIENLLNYYDSRRYTTLALADAAAVAAGKLLVIAQNHTLTANTILASPIMIIPGGSFTQPASWTLTINGSFQNPSNGQCFIGFAAGDVTFGAGSVEEIHAEWWGAKGDLATNDYTAIACAIAASSNITPAVLLSKGYKSNTKLTVAQSCQKLKGQGIGTVIWGNHTDYVLSVGYLGTYDAAQIKWGVAVEDLLAWSPTGKGIEFNEVANSQFSNLWAYSSGAGFVIHRHTQSNEFNRLVFSSNMAASIMAMYPLLPAVASLAEGILMEYVTVECNGNTLNFPLVEGAGSHGISIVGPHTRTSINDPLSEGNAGWGYYFNATDALGNDLKLKNGYAEANTLGSISGTNQIRAKIEGYFGSVAADIIELVGVSFSDFSNISAYSILANVGTYPNVTDKYFFSSNNKYSNIALGAGSLTGTSLVYPNTFENISVSGVITGLNPTAGTFTLTANAALTVIANKNVRATSRIIITPTTANAAADIGSATGVYISEKNVGVYFAVTHPNNANADKTFDYVIKD